MPKTHSKITRIYFLNPARYKNPKKRDNQNSKYKTV